MGARGAALRVAAVVGGIGLAAGLLVGPAEGRPGVLLLGEAHEVALLTGPGSINATDVRYGVHGTDLGALWETDRGQIFAAFGDTFGPAATDPRSNVLARSSDLDPEGGIHFDDFVTDRPGHAKELIGSRKVPGDQMTVIPTGGVNVHGRDYLGYMSVIDFGRPGHWTTSYAGLAYSDDDGQTWIDLPGTRRANTAAFDDGFQMVDYVRKDGYVYLYGTPNGRFGDVRLARAPEGLLYDTGSYEYWTGVGGWQPGDGRGAVPIVPGPVGELSVQYNQELHLWMMMYLDESQGAIAMRLSPGPTGPWLPELVVASDQAYPSLYGPFLHPRSNGLNVFFTMTRYDRYNVSLMRLQLPTNVLAAVRNLVPVLPRLPNIGPPAPTVPVPSVPSLPLPTPPDLPLPPLRF